ncbi:MAG: NAD(P)H-dependent oxidoreductase [Defluviitaleaceae bacterium]|nr:NAD(P)H-dependent oxidoreductase [Defluviitaleaceae bacterium]
MKICIINFSGRKGGNCHDVAKLVEQIEATEHEVTLLEMCDLDIEPCGKCGYECFSKDVICPYAGDAIACIYSAVCSSDLAYYIVPNYINYPNAYFFIFNERKQGFFAHKPDLLERYLRLRKKFVVISNTEEDNFREILGRHVLENGDVEYLFLATTSFDKGSARGGMMQCEQAKDIVRGFC